MSPVKTGRALRPLTAVAVFSLCAVVVVVLLFRRFGSIGDCNTNSDCPAGKVCLTAVNSTHSLVRWVRPERSCQVLCTRNSDCPPEEECSLVDGAFGPGPYCVTRPKIR